MRKNFFQKTIIYSIFVGFPIFVIIDLALSMIGEQNYDWKSYWSLSNLTKNFAIAFFMDIFISFLGYYQIQKLLKRYKVPENQFIPFQPYEKTIPCYDFEVVKRKLRYFDNIYKVVSENDHEIRLKKAFTRILISFQKPNLTIVSETKHILPFLKSDMGENLENVEFLAERLK